MRLYGKSAGGQPPRLGIYADDKLIASFDVTNTGEKSARFYEKVVTLPVGEHRITAKLLNPTADPKAKEKRGLWVQQIQLAGPLDNRPESHRKIMAHKPGLSKSDARGKS